MNRSHDWQIRLERFAWDRARMPFAWGTNDCAIFASDCVLAITGTDPAPRDLRGHRTAKEAYRAIATHGGLENIATEALGPSVMPSLASVGDVVLLEMAGRPAFAICNGSTALMPSRVGLVSVPMITALKAWKI